ncbi:MAG: dTMP kinase [Chloroflexaceae bacterium]|nr:dTMP kinase [Chloroflexaceae bacterium]NJO06782.1 dTMP kinase [Chloroflexaceae bacterium]
MSLFVTFEGPEGSGKSTQARLLYEHLQARGYPVILTREPGGTRIGELIRRILVDLQHTEMAPTTEILLFSAARAQLVSELVRPYLDAGGIVLCDRYADSTYAYQGYGLNRDLDELRAITSIATGGLQPDLTIYLDISAEEGLERKRQPRVSRTSTGKLVAAGLPTPNVSPPEWNRLDARDLAYHQRVANGFRELMLHEPERWRRMDARLPVDELARTIAEVVEPLLERITPLN